MLEAEYYYPFFLSLIFILCFWQSYRLSFSSFYDSLQEGNYDQYRTALFFVCFIVLFVGTRPCSPIFPDMDGYAKVYKRGIFVIDSVRFEPVWTALRYICHKLLGMSVTSYFVVVSFLIVGLRFIVCRKLFGTNVYTAFLFVVTSMTFWSDTTNIIRSSLARSFVLLGMVYFLYGEKINTIKALLLLVLGFYCHTSSGLLIGCFLLSVYLLKNIKHCLWVWFICLGFSLVAGDSFEHFFVSLGLDDRIEGYFSGNYKGFSHAGFRWDFLLYSIVPIALGWYVITRGYADRIYSILLNTYILSNAFWVLVIRATFSDRFAALSWTLYPLVIAYPFLMLPIWNNQHRKLALVLLANVFFLFFMQIYYTFRS